MLDKYKISILIITYNQQDVIGRAIESALVQKKYGLKEIVICDDNSTDSNWEIISEYVNKYPNIIRAYRNIPNLGIYPNCEKVISLRGDADLYYLLSGDDSLNDGWFKTIQEFIIYNNLDINEKAISIASDWKNIRPDGTEIINNTGGIVSIDDNYFSMSLRGLANRSIMVNKIVLNKFKPVETNQGICLAETLFDRQTFIYSEKIYYCPYIGTIYHSGIGISTKMNTREYIMERKTAYEKCLNIYDLEKKDRYLILSFIYKQELLLDPTLSNFFRYIYNKIRGLKLRYGYKIRKELIIDASLIKKIILKH